MDAAAARNLLEEGHRTFRRLVAASGVHQVLGVPEAPTQRPFAALVGCSDARVPPEQLFRRSPNELFVIRAAGTALGEDVLGSLDYALDHLAGSLRLVVVLGHSGCGAISAAVDVYLNPIHIEESIDSRSVRSLVSRLLLPVHAAAGALEFAFGTRVRERPGYRGALIELGVVTQAVLAAFQLQRELVESGATGIEVVWGVYDLAQQRVCNPLDDRGPNDDGVRLSAAPRSREDFVPLRQRLTGSAWVRDLLKG